VDHIADEISMLAVEQEIDDHIYVEHKIRDSYVKVLEPCCVDINGSSDEDEDNLYVYSSDDGAARDVRFMTVRMRGVLQLMMGLKLLKLKYQLMVAIESMLVVSL